MFLAFSFDYLPHRPHTATRSRNPIKATSVTSLLTRTDAWLLSLPLLYQNYHNIHHIWPYLPFYKYSQAWAAMSTSLLELGTEVAPILSFKSHPLLQQADE
jgi:fatty acid desaturase